MIATLNSVHTCRLLFLDGVLLFTDNLRFTSILRFPSLHSSCGLHQLLFCRTEEILTLHSHCK